MKKFTKAELLLLIVEIETYSGGTIKFIPPGKKATASQIDLFNIMDYWLWADYKKIKSAVSLFLTFPLRDMPLYLNPIPTDEPLPYGFLSCPTYSEGVFSWQTVLARWRIRIHK
jgi:hypothetical protein